VKALFVLVFAVPFVLIGCARPPAIGPEHPASPDAPKASSSPLLNALAVDTSTEKAAEKIGEATAGGHEGHQSEGTGTAATASTVYTCPHHPEVMQSTPGKCPKCGMTLQPKTTGGEAKKHDH
jgi:hypothetical protein